MNTLGPLLSKEVQFSNQVEQSHRNDPFNLLNVFLKNINHNFEFSTGIALFILGKQQAPTLRILKVELFTGTAVSGEHSSLAGLQRKEGNGFRKH